MLTAWYPFTVARLSVLCLFLDTPLCVEIKGKQTFELLNQHLNGSCVSEQELYAVRYRSTIKLIDVNVTPRVHLCGTTSVCSLCDVNGERVTPSKCPGEDDFVVGGEMVGGKKVITRGVKRVPSI